jgi:hypothetical protein
VNTKPKLHVDGESDARNQNISMTTEEIRNKKKTKETIKTKNIYLFGLLTLKDFLSLFY